MNLVTLRLVHYYAGVFFAPTIIFFALSGVLQVFKLHEAYRQMPGAQGDWIAWMSQVHKESALIPPKAAPQAAPDRTAARKSSEPRHEPPSSLFKWFAALMGISLIGASLAGLWIAYNYPKRRRRFFAALLAGIAIPIVLLQLSAAA
jgi:hypothetical protein